MVNTLVSHRNPNFIFINKLIQSSVSKSKKQIFTSHFVRVVANVFSVRILNCVNLHFVDGEIQGTKLIIFLFHC